MANPEHLQILRQGVKTWNTWRDQHRDVTADLSGADLSGAVLSAADLSGADLYRTNLYRADLRETKLDKADLSGANLREARLAGATMSKVRGAYRAHGMETTRFTPATGKGDKDVFYFETCIRPWREQWLNWERLKIMGRLPLFGVSSAVLILLPILVYGLELYNAQVEMVQAWAKQVMIQPDHLLHRLAVLVVERLQTRPMPQQSLLLLVSTLFLIVASTLYMLLCPSRVKEFSRDQWCDELGRSLVHYWPLAWKHRRTRLVCATCYALGGVGALWVIGTKVWRVLLFILKYSPYPWPWR